MIKGLLLPSILLVQFITPIVNAAPRLLCTDSGNLEGSYILDITGYEAILDGNQESFTRQLGFKRFRSSVEKVADLTCSKTNPYLDGPLTLMACYSGPVSDYGNHPAPFEAVLTRDHFGLMLNLRGPGIPASYKVPCQIKE